jgi:hypothetical protein
MKRPQKLVQLEPTAAAKQQAVVVIILRNGSMGVLLEEFISASDKRSYHPFQKFYGWINNHDFGNIYGNTGSIANGI